MTMNTDTSQESLMHNENLICPISDLSEYVFFKQGLVCKVFVWRIFSNLFYAVVPFVNVVRNQQL